MSDLTSKTTSRHMVANILMVGFVIFWIQIFARISIVLTLFIHDPSVTNVHIPWIGLWSIDRNGN